MFSFKFRNVTISGHFITSCCILKIHFVVFRYPFPVFCSLGSAVDLTGGCENARINAAYGLHNFTAIWTQLLYVWRFIQCIATNSHGFVVSVTSQLRLVNVSWRGSRP